MTAIENCTWEEFVWVRNFFANRKSDGYVQDVEQLLIHHLDCFLENLGDLSEEQRERFHQDIRTIEER